MLVIYLNRWKCAMNFLSQRITFRVYELLLGSDNSEIYIEIYT